MITGKGSEVYNFTSFKSARQYHDAYVNYEQVKHKINSRSSRILTPSEYLSNQNDIDLDS